MVVREPTFVILEEDPWGSNATTVPRYAYALKNRTIDTLKSHLVV
jgi:hypothetical protein